MTEPARPSSDEQGIAVVGASRVRADIVTPHGISMYSDLASLGSSELAVPSDVPQRIEPAGRRVGFDAFEQAATEINPRQDLAAVEQATPTEVVPRLPDGQTRPERGPPLLVFSMKAQTDAAANKPRAEDRVPLHVQLRSMAEVVGRVDTPAHGLGYLAPPRDQAQPAPRPRRGVIVRLAVAVAMAASIACAIWLLAGR